MGASGGILRWLFGCGICSKPMPAQVTGQATPLHGEGPYVRQFAATSPPAGASNQVMFTSPPAMAAAPGQFIPQQGLTQQLPPIAAPCEASQMMVLRTTVQELSIRGPSAEAVTKLRFCSSCGFQFVDDGMFCSGC